MEKEEGMMMAGKKQSLLEYEAEKMGVPITDLRLIAELRSRVLQDILTMEEAVYSLAEWRSALSYVLQKNLGHMSRCELKRMAAETLYGD